MCRLEFRLQAALRQDSGYIRGSPRRIAPPCCADMWCCSTNTGDSGRDRPAEWAAEGRPSAGSSSPAGFRPATVDPPRRGILPLAPSPDRGGRRIRPGRCDAPCGALPEPNCQRATIPYQDVICINIPQLFTLSSSFPTAWASLPNGTVPVPASPPRLAAVGHHRTRHAPPCRLQSAWLALRASVPNGTVWRPPPQPRSAAVGHQRTHCAPP